jgi:hypothetical protein
MTKTRPGRASTKGLPELPYDPKNELMSISMLNPKKIQKTVNVTSLPFEFTRTIRTALLSQ